MSRNHFTNALGTKAAAKTYNYQHASAQTLIPTRKPLWTTEVPLGKIQKASAYKTVTISTPKIKSKGTVVSESPSIMENKMFFCKKRQ
jgi:hypothetical protein